MSSAQTDAEQACLARLVEMDEALRLMQRELPEDAQPVGSQARSTVALWKAKLAQGGADLSQLTVAMNEVSELMDALTARLLLVPWDGHPNRGRPS
jgi:hypothetical protein